MPRLITLVAWGALGCALSGCPPPLPDGVECAGRHISAGSTAQLTAALAEARDGDCVILRAGRYDGPQEVRGQVTLVAERDASAIIAGGAVSGVVQLTGEGARLVGVDIAGGADHGVVVTSTTAEIAAARVTDSPQAGIAIRCEDAGCFRPESGVTITDVQVTGAAFGLWIGGARVTLDRCTISGSASSSLSGGAALYAVEGARLEMTGSTVEENALGVILDGVETRARLHDVVVRANGALGVWAQGLRGSMEAPALEIVGRGTDIDQNGITGVGISDTLGVRIHEATIRRTVIQRVPANIAQMAEIGDGVGLLDGASQITVEAVRMEDNGRAQAVVDTAGPEVRFSADNTVTAGAGQHRIVVQNSAVTVEVPPGDLSTVEELPLSTLSIGIPDAL